MKRIAHYLFLIGTCGTILLGCGKYEDGPEFSLRSKKARLEGSWKPVKYINPDGTEKTAHEDDIRYTFTKEGSVTLSMYVTICDVPDTWVFVNDKEAIKLSSAGSDFCEDQVFTILRLKNDELWWKDEYGKKTYFEAE